MYHLFVLPATFLGDLNYCLVSVEWLRDAAVMYSMQIIEQR